MPAVPTPPTIADGPVPSTLWNQLRDAILFLQGKPIAQLRQTSSQNVLTATVSPIEFQTEVFDLDPDLVGGHDNSTNNTRWTARYPGYYLLSGMVTFQSAAGGARYAGLRVNGSDIPGSYKSVAGSSADVNGVACKTMRWFLDVGDYVELVGFQSSGGTIVTYTAFSAWQSGLAIGWDRVQ